MTILTFPTMRLPSQASLRMMGNTQSAESPFDGSVQTIVFPGAKWRATMTWQPMPGADNRPLQAFITQLGGRAGRFTYNHPMTWRRCPTTVSGTPTVAHGSNSGSLMDTTGWPANSTVLYVGDFISFQDPAGRWRMHQITVQAGTDSSGNVTLAFAPPLRVSPAAGSAIDIVTPKATWMLTTDDTGDFSTNGTTPGRSVVALDITEAVTGTPT